MNSDKTFIEEAATTGAIIAIFFTLAGVLATLVRIVCLLILTVHQLMG